MTRIIAGVAGGRPLRVPAGRTVRPTSERAREGLFSSLMAARGDLTGARFLDLYAGSGAVGLEAVSRGAATATLVEAESAVLRVLRANVAELALPGVEVLAMRVEKLLDEQTEHPYEIVFLDPPYALDVTPVLARLVGWVEDQVVVEQATRTGPPTWPPGLVGEKARKYGDTTLWYGRRS